eukprot:TRINITY_DN91762_c0_g1_i1.p1 TRINITY_DN91762_c0_g1~~TRINITY_DN91762_c0_g1_i1.p1  ORF type:complete len:374 (-),score=52.82 TRINITY_DN91762_c0_g1_i1:156-1277(-)
MEASKRICKEHNSTLALYCANCQKMICILCITDHSMKSHQLMSPIDYAKNILKSKICEQLAVLNEKKAKYDLLESSKGIKTCINLLEDLVKGLTQGLDSLKESLLFLQKAMESMNYSSPIEEAENMMKGLLDEIAGYSKESDIPVSIRADEKFKEISESLRSKDLSELNDTLAAVKQKTSIVLESTLKEINGISLLGNKFANKFISMDPAAAKFCTEYSKGKWTVSNNGKTCTKSYDSSYISICNIDQPLKDCEYLVEYFIDTLTSKDTCDSIGITTKDKFSICAFNSKDMYGILNGKVCSNGINKEVPFKFREKDRIKLIYSGKNGTLQFHVNGKQIGDTLTVVPKQEYYTGVAFRNTGTVISLTSFFKSNS